MNTDFSRFITAPTAEAAVDRLAELHQQASSALHQALKRYVATRTEPSAAERAQFRYPELRLTHSCQGEVPASTRAYAKVQAPTSMSRSKSASATATFPIPM